MNDRARLAMLLVAFALLAFPVWRVASAIPAFGAPTAAYGQLINLTVPAARHVANMVSAVNFDVRAIDTLGEEMMLIAAVTGAIVLLRGSRGEDAGDRADHPAGRAIVGRADAVIIAARTAAGLLMAFGLYMALMGTQTPGGGFQAGVVLSTAFLLVYLGEGYRSWRRLVRGPGLAMLEGAGGLLFVGAAIVPLLLGHAALENTLSLGETKGMTAGGLMVIANWAIAISVTGSFGAMALEFLEETRAPKDGEDEGAEERA